MNALVWFLIKYLTVGCKRKLRHTIIHSSQIEDHLEPGLPRSMNQFMQIGSGKIRNQIKMLYLTIWKLFKRGQEYRSTN